MAGGHPIDSFGSILSGLAKRLGLESRLVELRLQHRWGDIIGEPIGAHTWPDQIRFKKLYLVVRNSVWLQQLTFLKPALLAKLQAETGRDTVTEIVFRVGEIPAPASVPGPPGKRGPTEAAAAQIAEAAAYISALQDPALRQRFTEVISTYPSPTPLPPEEDPSRAP